MYPDDTYYKFSELSETAKDYALKEYFHGWHKTHPSEEYDDSEVRELCIDNDNDWAYNEKCKFLGDICKIKDKCNA